jgi:hypothetical protein
VGIKTPRSVRSKANFVQPDLESRDFKSGCKHEEFTQYVVVPTVSRAAAVNLRWHILTRHVGVVVGVDRVIALWCGR